MPLKRFFPLLVVLGFMLSLLFQRCAVIVSPVGGPMDTIPPVMVKSVPLPNSTEFKKGRISLTFDEYIKLDKIQEKLVLSPPQERLPDIRIKGKTLDVRFFEPLTDSTTYTLYFSDAIRDINEGNAISSFEFAFSTGSYIDSLRYYGRIIDAFTLEPKSGILVMLYEQFSDSIPLLSRPRYVTKTNEKGLFILGNLKPQDYKIFALRDGNSNYLFDQPNEDIAYAHDRVKAERLFSPTDTVPIQDSLQTLWLFQEKSRVHSLVDYSRPQMRKLSMVFTQKPMGEVSITPIGYEVDSVEWYLPGGSLKGDSLTLWLTHEQMSRDDSLRMRVSYFKTDSVMKLVPQIDTLRFFYKEPTKTASRRRGATEAVPEEDKKIPTQNVNTTIKNGNIVLPDQRFGFKFDMPQRRVDSSVITLMNTTDSTLVSLPPLVVDTLNPCVYSFPGSWDEDVRYNLTALPGAFINLDGIANDTLKVNFRGTNPEKFGIISLTVSGVQEQLIVQLVGGGKVVAHKTLQTDGKVKFTYVKPGKYTIRMIVDNNRNGEWDTGYYLEGWQPERVYMYEDNLQNREIQVRANWDYELNYTLK